MEVVGVVVVGHHHGTELVMARQRPQERTHLCNILVAVCGEASAALELEAEGRGRVCEAFRPEELQDEAIDIFVRIIWQQAPDCRQGLSLLCVHFCCRLARLWRHVCL